MEELKRARRAACEIALVKQRKQRWFWGGFALLNFILQALLHQDEWSKWFWLAFLFLLVCVGAYCWIAYRGLETRYPGNVEFLRVLGEREPGLADRIGDPFAYAPLLNAWNRRLSQRAILWRVDRFLRGSVSV